MREKRRHLRQEALAEALHSVSLLRGRPVRQLEDGAELELIEPTEGANEMTQGGAKEYEM